MKIPTCGSGVTALSFLIGAGSKTVHTSRGGESLDLRSCCPSDVSSCVEDAGYVRELLNVSSSSSTLCIDPEIPLSVIMQTVEIFMVGGTPVLLTVSPSLRTFPSPFFFFLNPCMLPTCRLCLIQSSELLIQFSIKCVERCCRLPSCYVSALCFPPQGHFTNLFDLRL